jgi:hypothetical protein
VSQVPGALFLEAPHIFHFHLPFTFKPELAISLLASLETQQPPTWLRAYSACLDLSRVGLSELIDDQPFTTSIRKGSTFFRVNFVFAAASRQVAGI